MNWLKSFLKQGDRIEADALAKLRQEKYKLEKEIAEAKIRKKVAELASEMEWWENPVVAKRNEHYDYKYRSS